MRTERVRAPPGPVVARIEPPGSKSLTNRALLLAAMAEGRSVLTGCLEADDTRLMRACLSSLGVGVIAEKEATTVTVVGAGASFGQTTPAEPLYVGTAGTAARFLTAALIGAGATGEVDGSPRMRERPMAALLDGLRHQGGQFRCLGEAGFLPVALEGGGLRGGTVTLSRPASSQFVSALAIAALLAEAPTRIVLERGTPARPYVDMTLAVVEHFGGAARWAEANTILVEPSSLRAHDYPVEPDASAASYFQALAAIRGGRVEIPRLGRSSLQGDAQFHTVLARMGATTDQSEDTTVVSSDGHLRGVDLDLTDMPDMTLTAAVAALFAEGPTSIRGVGILRHHESDRIAAGATELRKLGATVREHDDGLDIEPPAHGPRPGVGIDTYDDHRMAMAFALAGDVVIHEPECVGKTFPRYFDVLADLGMRAD